MKSLNQNQKTVFLKDVQQNVHKQRQKPTRFVIDLRENVLDGLVVIPVLGFWVRWSVTPLPAPLYNLFGLWRCEGL